MNNKHLFSSPELLSRLSFTQPSNGVYYVQAVPSQKPMRALPEEIIRQLMILSLIHQYYYPEHGIRVEYPVQMGRTKKRADVVVIGESGSVHLVIEVKQEIDQDTLEQLKSYLMVTGAAYGAAVSAHEFICLKRESGNRFTELADIPLCNGGEDVVGDALHADAASKTSSTAMLRTSLQIERVEKIDRTYVKMTVQGHPLNLSIAELASYKKTQKRFLSAGVILATEIKQPVWLSFIRELLAGIPDPTANAIQHSSDEQLCLRRILSHRLILPACERSIAELVRVAAALDKDDIVSVSQADDHLARIGIRVDGKEMRISNSHNSIAKILKDTSWFKNWGRVLRRLPGAQATGPHRFGAITSRGVGIPLSLEEYKAVSDPKTISDETSVIAQPPQA